MTGRASLDESTVQTRLPFAKKGRPRWLNHGWLCHLTFPPTNLGKSSETVRSNVVTFQAAQPHEKGHVRQRQGSERPGNAKGTWSICGCNMPLPCKYPLAKEPSH